VAQASLPGSHPGRGRHQRQKEFVTHLLRRAKPADHRKADGTEPDARFTLANERTFLAWSRTALGLVIGGLATAQLLPPFPGVPWGRHAIAVPVILLGSVVSVVCYREWTGNQRALRRGEPLSRSRLPRILTIAIAAIALGAAALALLSAARTR
jgi:putative membrane protein